MSSKSNSRQTDKIFEGHVRDLVTSSEYQICVSEFLTPLEQRFALDVARAEGAGERCFFWGGVPEAERRCAVFLPDWLCPEYNVSGSAFDSAREEYPKELIESGADAGELSSKFVAVEIYAGSYSDLSHRDFLGAVLSLGLERDCIGDIAVTDPHSAIIFMTAKASALILADLERIGNDTVKVKIASLDRSFRIPKEYEVITESVMSARLDGIVKALCKITREAASELVEKGDVTLNYIVETRCDRQLIKGDVISVRGYGKFIYDGDRGINRRGRLRIDARKYI